MFKPSSFKTALAFCNRSFDRFNSKLIQQKELLRIVRYRLPDDLAGHIHCCLLTENKLIIYTDSAIWASQLRFYQAKLATAVTPLSKNPTLQTQIKILTEPVGPSRSQSHTAKVPSMAQRNALRSLSRRVPDSELGRALGKLANTLERLGPDR